MILPTCHNNIAVLVYDLYVRSRQADKLEAHVPALASDPWTSI
jgi:hypothetical protein